MSAVRPYLLQEAFLPTCAFLHSGLWYAMAHEFPEGPASLMNEGRLGTGQVLDEESASLTVDLLRWP